MNNFHFITPEEYVKKNGEGDHTLKELKKIANMKAQECMNCNEDVWKLVGLGMCFSCITGEWDASKDYEIKF